VTLTKGSPQLLLFHPLAKTRINPSSSIINHKPATAAKPSL
jgi:hypothetical protein